jgi:hypothetical protein
MNTQAETLQVVGPKNTFPAVSLIEPTESGYLLLAIEVDHRPPIGFFTESGRKKKLLAQLKSLTTALAGSDDVLDASVFKAIIVPPGARSVLEKTP